MHPKSEYSNCVNASQNNKFKENIICDMHIVRCRTLNLTMNLQNHIDKEDNQPLVPTLTH